MRTVHQVSELSGVSVRTLHHYDKIGLLKPSAVTRSGYRLYDDAAVARLQTILLYRELAFPLKTILQILDSPGFDPNEALRQQSKMLMLQKEHLEQLITLVENLIQQEESVMDFNAFDQSKLEEYRKEAKERWGNTNAYRENESWQAGKSGAQQKTEADGMMQQFAKLGRLKDLPVQSEPVQKAVAAIQQYITDYFYTCTKEIFAGLGQMYAADERFSTNIDAVGGPGTAAFASEAIAYYCR